jgi:O-antigen/teichoic acid export membrane protein
VNRNMFKRAKLNAITGYISFIISSVLIFFISPFLIKFLGPSIFGVWKTIQRTLSFASIVDGRSAQALKWIIANDESSNNIKIKQQAVGSALKIWLYFLPFVILIVFFLVYNLPSLINGLDANLYPVIYQAGLILGANLLLDPLLRIPDAILVGTNRGYKSTFIQILGILISNSLMLLVSFLGYGLIGLSYVVLIVTLFNAILIYWICNRNIDWFGIQKPSKEQVHEFFNFSFWVFAWSFVIKLILSTEILLIGYLISSEMVTNYVLSTYMIQLVISIALLTGSAITPSLGNLIGSNEMQKSKEIVRSLREVITFIALFFGSLIILINKDFVSLWMGEVYYLGSYSNILIVATMIILVLTRLEGQVQDLSLNIKNKVISGFLVSTLSVALGFVCFHYFQNKIEGLFFGILIGRIILNLIFTNMVNRMMELKSNYARYILLIILLIILFQIEKLMPTASSWTAFIFKSISISMILLPLYFLILFSKSTKNNILKYLLK